ncbi:hypothetical protein C8046_16050 [Serinibacter arcticus]|uniref:Uncharacterized protein n=1 Tax=Serinibacter arcticus TaxID=1655435 RepID=A0A2U1ZYD5_9MICO|nr:DUF4012 domain-containing protein [Serinibacter arcticus]PWD51932.1 hypothetical protein C8046_16050 [Serinibacter arcticus]
MVTRRRRRRPPRPLRRTGAVAGWCLLVVATTVVAAGVWTAADALRVRDQLTDAAALVPQLEEQVRAGDLDAVTENVAALRSVSAAAVRTTHAPHWDLFSRLPGVGPDVAAVRTLTDVVAELADGALPRLPDVVAAVSPASLAPVDGRVDVAAVAEQAPHVVAADDSVLRALATLATIDRDGLLPQVTDAADRLEGELTQLRTSTATAARAVRLLPAMLGADGPRQYLLVVQNNAEPRALGGIAGSVVLLRTEDGRVEIVEQRAGNTLTFPTSPLPLEPVETALFGDQVGRYLINATSTPDFPRAAELAASAWRAETGTTVDGVLSVDPVALAAVLGATGPVTTSTGVTLDSDNAAAYLLNQIYLDEPDPAGQDLFFTDAASAVFDALSSGAGDAGGLLTSLVAATDAHRLLLWSSHPVEQEALAGTVLAGELRGDLGGAPVVGVALNDGSGAKVGYYLDVRPTVTVLECRPDGSQRLGVSVALRSDVPDPATLPEYVTGGGVFVPEGMTRTNVLVYAPTAGRVLTAGSDGGETAVLSQSHDGLAVVSQTVDLMPGESRTLEYELLSGPDLRAAPHLRLTPGPRASQGVVEPGCAEETR